MHITALCPHCHNRYQVDPGLRGMRMRCPNASCRLVFIVQDVEQVNSKTGGYTELVPDVIPLPEEPPKSGTKESNPKSTGSVGEFVKVMEAEVVQEVPPAAKPPVSKGKAPRKDAVPTLPADVVNEQKPARPSDTATWRESPPVRKSSGPADGHPTTPPSPDSPAEEPPSWHEPPPVRRRQQDGYPDITGPDGGQVNVFEADTLPQGALAPAAASAADLAPPPAAKGARRALFIFLGLVLVVGVGAGAIVVFALNAVMKRESNLFTTARNDYADEKYASAAGAFENLIKDFPKSDQLPRYRLYAELSQIRDQVHTVQSDSVAALEKLTQFVKENKNKALFKEFQSDVGLTYRKLVESLSDEAKRNLDANALARARTAFSESQAFKLNEGTVDDGDKLKELIAAAQEVIARAEKRRQALDQIGRFLTENKPTNDTVARARAIAEQEGLKDDAEAKRLIAQLEEAVRLWVKYVPRRTAPTALVSEPVEPSLLVAPLTGGFTNRLQASRRIILALVEGVLYGMDQGTGEVRWVTRVGIDTTTLPIRLEASPTSPELFLVLSAARNTVMTLVAQTGHVYWQHKLSGPCLGRPVIIGPWAYVPTYDGRVYEIETFRGYLQGYFDLGQPLTVGGVRQEGTDLLYIPGDSDNLYVLDTAVTAAPNQPSREKKCVMILHTGHPSGSLRSEPIIVTRPDPFARTPEAQASWPPYLILSQTDGLNHMRLRVFSLPIENPDAQAILQPEPRVSGWSWFQPYHDGEKLAFVTDLGVFGLFGINQVRNEDRPIFPALAEEEKPAESPLGRAQVVAAVENDFWVLANGELQRMQFDLFAQKMLPMWPASLPLGSPLHTGQLDETGKTLYVVSQDLKRQVYLATAVDAERGKIIWQRQLGLDSQGDPLVVAGRVVVADRGGNLFAFDTSREPLEPGQNAWWKTDALQPGEPAPGTAYLFAANNGASIYQVCLAENAMRLTVRKYRLGNQGEAKLVKEKEQQVNLPGPMRGAPVLGPQGLLLLLADGTMQRIDLSLEGNAGAGGPNWNSPRADEGARGYVVQISADEFLTTDGSRGLTHWQWPPNKPFNTIQPTVDLPARIVAAPVVLPQASPSNDLRVIVADADNNLTLLRGPELKIERVWPLGGEITAGPFLRGQRIGCIVERHRLVWIDPARDKEMWRYIMPGEAIVGEPQLIGDALVLANLSGRFLALNPETGKPRGAAYHLKARAAPVATPVAYGKDAAFVPLSDHTVFLLPLNSLRGSLAGLPFLTY